MTTVQITSNIDEVRAEIMRLEGEKVFDQRAWARVLAQLSNSPSRRQDAVRRMMTAKQNATAILEQPNAGMVVLFSERVAVEKMTV